MEIPSTDVNFTHLSQTTNQPSKKRSYEELDKENFELQEKIIKLEAYVDKLAKDCAEQEDKKADVEEELEKLKREQPLALIEKMKEHVLDLGQVLKNSIQASPSAYSPSVSYLSSPTSLGGSQVPVIRAVAPHNVVLFKEVLINEGSLRKAKVALKTDGNSKKSRNNGVSIILDALYQPEELAKMSLSGNSCPSILGSKAKPAIPKEVLDEIIGFMIRFWEQAYKGYILTEQQVKESVSAKLMAVHTKGKKIKKKCWLTTHQLRPTLQELPSLLWLPLRLHLTRMGCPTKPWRYPSVVKASTPMDDSTNME
ncbi:hypothetical protein GHT06_009096 [Daphnia sinensis]|uniref:BEN domain-containing protein n=1 Tax=Daphnia sinensis TaxID=1820382 RepID=A0AAD5PZH1_9CRUS|nr:hypothetical protein GHT06_009096 [Daphnia sinensis]